MSGLRKAAIVLMNMDRALSAEVLKHLGEQRAELLAAELTRLENVDVATTGRALTDFKRILDGRGVVSRGGTDVATGLLEQAFGKDAAAGIIAKVASPVSAASFDFLNAADPSQVATILDGELPHTVAVVLANLRPDRAAQILAALPDPARTDVAQSIATMGTATQEAITIVADSLRARTGVFAMRDAREQIGGVQPLVEIINRSDTALEKALLASLEARDVDLAEDIRSRMVTFADIVKLEDRDLQLVLRGIDLRGLARALKGADQQVDEKIRKNMTERNRETLTEEIRVLGKLRLSEVDEARAEVVRVIRELEAAGEITVKRNDEDVFVE